MATRESSQDRGKRRGKEIFAATVATLRSTRIGLGLSQTAVAKRVGCSQSLISLFERNKLDDVSFVFISTVAAVLGLEPSLTFHRAGPAIRDAGHESLIGRFLRVLSPAWHVAREVPFPNLSDPRWWDLLLRLGSSYRLAVEAETRIRDLQALVRRMHERIRDGGADHLLLILSDSSHNRALVDQLREALGEGFAATPAQALAAIREGRPLPGSAVVLL